MILCVLGLVGCEPRCQKFYYPILSFNMFPANRDTINVGDTLWLRSDTKSVLNDWWDNETRQYINFNFIMNICARKIVDTTVHKYGYVEAIDKFDVGTKLGTLRQINNTSYRLTLLYENEQYKFLGYIIPKDTGLYAFDIPTDLITSGTLGSPFKKIEITDTKCEELLRRVMIQINNGVTKKYLLDGKYKFFYSPLSASSNKIQSWCYQNSSYYFYVKR